MKMLSWTQLIKTAVTVKAHWLKHLKHQSNEIMTKLNSELKMQEPNDELKEDQIQKLNHIRINSANG